MTIFQCTRQVISIPCDKTNFGITS